MKIFFKFSCLIICIMLSGLLSLGAQVLAASTELYYFTGDKLYFDMQSLEFLSSSTSGGDIKFTTFNYFTGVNGAAIKDLGTVSFENAAAPATGYSTDRVYIKLDHVYAVRCGDGSYGIIKITNCDSGDGTAEFMVKESEPKEKLDLYHMDADNIRFSMATMSSTQSSKDSNLYYNPIRMTIKGENGTAVKDLGAVDYAQAKAPSTGYASGDVKLAVNNVYAIRVSSESFYILKVTSIITESGFEFMARSADVQASPAGSGQSGAIDTPAVGTPDGTKTSDSPAAVDKSGDVTSISELYWVENGTKFVMGGKIIFQDNKGVAYPFISPDSKYVVYSNGEDSLLLYDIKSKTLKTIYQLDGLENQVNYQVFPVGWSQDSKQVAFITSYRGGFTGGNQLIILTLGSKKTSVVAKGLSSAYWGKGGKFAIANGSDVWLVDQNGRNKVTLTVPTANAFFGADNVSFSEDGTKVIYIVADTYYLHDIKTDTCQELKIPEAAAANGVVRAGSGGRIAVVEDRKIYVYYTATGNYGLMYQDADSAYPGWLQSAKTSLTKDTASQTSKGPSKVKADRANASVIVDGTKVNFEAYTINEHTYFKLRDIAMVLAESSKQFEVTWDSNKDAINLISNTAYTPTGGELTVSSNTKSRDAVASIQKIFVDGLEVKLSVYNINGSNYFMLKDLGKLFNFNVAWDGKNKAILIDTRKDY